MTQDELREIQEAIDAGYCCLSALNEAESHIVKARRMGLWDLFGGGLISGMLKHSQMDQAQRCLERAQYELNSFRRELSDVNMGIQAQINFDELMKFVDIFCDNFFVDLFVQSRIEEVANNLQQVKMQVQQVISRLQAMKQGY